MVIISIILTPLFVPEVSHIVTVKSQKSTATYQALGPGNISGKIHLTHIREQTFLHCLQCQKIEQYQQTCSSAPVTQKHIFLIVLVALRAFLLDAPTSLQSDHIVSPSEPRGESMSEYDLLRHGSAPLSKQLKMLPPCLSTSGGVSQSVKP